MSTDLSSNSATSSPSSSGLTPPLHTTGSSLFSATILSSSNCTQVPVLLDLEAANFTKWDIFFKALLGRHGLLRHVDGTAPAQPANTTWVSDDCVVRTIMYGSMMGEVLDIILDKGQDACAMWVADEALFFGNKESHANVLLSEFHGIQQGDLSITTYCKEQKCLVDALRDIDSRIIEHMLVLNVMRGLNKPMASVATVISMSTTWSDFTATHYALFKEEMHLSTVAKAEAASALLSSTSKSSPCSGGACRGDGSLSPFKVKNKWNKKGGGSGGN